MAQKTHPIGFRLGVQTKGSQPGYHRWKDLHGTSSRWTVQNGGVERYAVLTQRDKIIKNLVEQFLEEDGYLVNKCIVHRTSTYVGVYVDVIRLEDEALTRTSFKPAKKTSATPSKPSETFDKTTSLQDYLSKKLEYGLPCIIQVYELNEYLSAQATAREASQSNKADARDAVGLVDFRNAIKLAQSGFLRGTKKGFNATGNPLPISNARAKIVSHRLSGGRRHRDVLRSIRKELASAFENNKSKFVDTAKSEEKSSSIVKGFQRILKGRISGSERSRILRYRSGPRPRHTVSAALDHGFAEVNTPSGKLSVTIRLYISSNGDKTT